MADTKAKPRKKPVRKAPVQKDYPTKLDWLRAMTEYEETQAEATTAAKVARLDKRIQAKLSQIEIHRAQLDRLTAERAELTGHGHEPEVEADEPEAEDETTAG